MDRRVGLTALVIAAMAGVASAAGDPEWIIATPDQPDVRAPREGAQKRRVEIREQRRSDRETNKKIRVERKARRGGEDPVMVLGQGDDDDDSGEPKVRVFTKKLDDGNVVFAGPGSAEGKRRVEVFTKKLGGHGGPGGQGGGRIIIGDDDDDAAPEVRVFRKKFDGQAFGGNDDQDVFIVGPRMSGGDKKRIEVFAKKLGGQGAGPHSFEWKSDDDEGGEPKVRVFRKTLKGGGGAGGPHAFKWHSDDEDHDDGPHVFTWRGEAGGHAPHAFEWRGEDDDRQDGPGVQRFSFPGGEGRVIIRRGPQGKGGDDKATIERDIVRGFRRGGGDPGGGGGPHMFEFRVPGPDGAGREGPEIKRFEMRTPGGRGGAGGRESGPRQHRIVIPRGGGGSGQGHGEIMLFRDGEGHGEDGPQIKRFSFPGGEGQIMLFGGAEGEGPEVRVLSPDDMGGEWKQHLQGGGEWLGKLEGDIGEWLGKLDFKGEGAEDNDGPDGERDIIIRKFGPGGEWREGGDAGGEGMPKIRFHKLDEGNGGEWMPKIRTRPINYKDCSCV